MKKYVILMVSIFLLLVGCQTTTEKNDEVQFIEVEILVPEKLNPNEEITISAQVTLGEEKVNDASEVKFEIWEKGQENHEMYNANSQDDGIYSIKHSFEHAGIYYIVAHVTARDMHNMPKQEVRVGTFEESKYEDVNEDTETNHDEHGEHGTNDEHEGSHDDHGEGSHAHGHLEIIYQLANAVSVNEDTELAVKLVHEGEPLEGAKVTFEIWEEKQEKHEFYPASEKNSGMYSIDYTFPQKGSYFLKVHVEKNDIHEHVEKQIHVH
ncbi:FixH family protein [Bacillus timonensis]|nr:FixH family protein [Bacillus timonensis]